MGFPIATSWWFPSSAFFSSLILVSSWQPKARDFRVQILYHFRWNNCQFQVHAKKYSTTIQNAVDAFVCFKVSHFYDIIFVGRIKRWWQDYKYLIWLRWCAVAAFLYHSDKFHHTKNVAWMWGRTKARKICIAWELRAHGSKRFGCQCFYI